MVVYPSEVYGYIFQSMPSKYEGLTEDGTREKREQVDRWYDKRAEELISDAIVERIGTI